MRSRDIKNADQLDQLIAQTKERVKQLEQEIGQSADQLRTRYASMAFRSIIGKRKGGLANALYQVLGQNDKLFALINHITDRVSSAALKTADKFLDKLFGPIETDPATDNRSSTTQQEEGL